MMKRIEMNEDMMVQVNGGAKVRPKTENIMNHKAVMDDFDKPYNLTTPDGRHYYSDGHHHHISMEIE